MSERVLVVKVGSSTITHAQGIDGRALLRLCGTIAELSSRGWKTLIVTSGAVGAGKARLGLAQRPREIALKQAAAAVGQGLLMHAYETFLAPLGLASAQLLLTRSDLADRQRYLNASNTLRALLAHDLAVVPIINENDSVAIDELKFGDNDTLSALVAQLVEAQWLAILSDVDGLYDANPQTHPEARLIPQVDELSPQILALAGGAGSAAGTGGMITKLEAARIATSAGIPMALMSGQRPDRLLELVEGKAIHGTVFRAREDRLEARKRWLAFGVAPHGALTLDAGALRAVMEDGKSLLPAGITALEGDFNAGETVSVRDAAGREVARGISNYAHSELLLIMGRKTHEIETLLGFKVADEVIHANNLARLAR